MDQEILGKELQRFNITDAAIATLSDQYMALTIKDLADKDGYKKVHEARMDVKNRRIAVQKAGKDLREEAIKYQKTIITEEKRIISLLEPIEAHLTAEETKIDDEKAAIKATEEKLLAERLQARVDRVCAMGAMYNGQAYLAHGILILPDTIKSASDPDFEGLLQVIQGEIDAEAAKAKVIEDARLAEEERLRKVSEEQAAEKKRLAEEAKKQAESAARIKDEQDAKEKTLEDEKARLKAEQEAIEKEKQRLIDEENARLKAIEDEKIRVERARVQAEEIEKAKKEAAAKALKDAEEKARKEAEAKAKKEAAAKLAAEKKEARRPDKAKLQSYVDTIMSVPHPELKTEEGKAVWEKVNERLEAMNVSMNAWIEEL
jgi:hypothetical protein